MNTIKFEPEIETTLNGLGIKGKVVNNMLKQLGNPKSDKFQNVFKDSQQNGMSGFLKTAFIWMDTPEGHMYWQDLHVKLNGGKL